MHDDAVKAGVTILNEVGVDPGIDHMSSMAVGGDLGRMLLLVHWTVS